MPLLFTATAVHPCSTPNTSKGSIPIGSMWQCSECWRIWQADRSGGWTNDHQPGERIEAQLNPLTGIIALVRCGTGETYAHVNERGNYVDAEGNPEAGPSLMFTFDQEVSEKQLRGFVSRLRGNRATATADQETTESRAKHANGNDDVGQFAEHIETVRTARKLLEEDADAKKTALGLIVLLIIACSVTVSVLAMTGNLG